MEEMIVSQHHRMPGLKSSFAGLETLRGSDLDIDFDDFLGTDPIMDGNGIDHHSQAEAMLGIQLPKTLQF